MVQDLDGFFYIVAEPDVPYGSGMHAVLLQTNDLYTTFSPPLINCAANPQCLRFLMDPGCALIAYRTTYLHHHHVVRMQIMFLL